MKFIQNLKLTGTFLIFYYIFRILVLLEISKHLFNICELFFWYFWYFFYIIVTLFDFRYFLDSWYFLRFFGDFLKFITFFVQKFILLRFLLPFAVFSLDFGYILRYLVFQNLWLFYFLQFLVPFEIFDIVIFGTFLNPW